MCGLASLGLLALLSVSSAMMLTCGAGDGFGPCRKDRDGISTSRGAYGPADVATTTMQTVPLHHREYNVQYEVQYTDSSSSGDRQAEIESIKSVQAEAADIWITIPTNDAVLSVGDVSVSFETLGFEPSVITPVEVFVPQNGHAPALLKGGNAVTLLMDRPCTQLVTLAATVGSRRVSTSVLFSTIVDEITVRSSRVPLPSDASWGVPLVHAPSKKLLNNRSKDLIGLAITRAEEGAVGRKQGQGAAKSYENVHRRGAHSLGGAAGQLRSTVSPQGNPRPLAILFVGSLTWDGQKHIWMQQMERLSRQRFEPKFLTFQETAGESRGAVSWRKTTVEKFRRRLRSVDVPLITIPPPLLDVEWVNLHSSKTWGELNGNGGANVTERSVPAPTTPLKETVFKLILESFDRAGGRSHLMDPPWARKIFEHVAGAIKTVSPDVLIFANGRTLGDAVLTRAARQAMPERSRIVMDFPNMDPAQGIDADVLVAPSHYVSRHPAVRALAEKIGASIVVIPPGVDVSLPPVDRTGFNCEANPDNIEDGRIHHRDSGCDSRTPVIGFAGRLAPEKGPGLFLAVAAEVTNFLPSARFIIAGDGPLRSALEAMAARLGITRQVHFAGWVDGPDLQRLMKEMDLLFNPSLASSETFCVVNIEAMAAGTPVAAFGIGGMLEYLTLGVNALALDDPNPRASAATIVEALQDRRRIESYAVTARADIIKNFQDAFALERWAQLYEAL